MLRFGYSYLAQNWQVHRETRRMTKWTRAQSKPVLSTPWRTRLEFPAESISQTLRCTWWYVWPCSVVNGFEGNWLKSRRRRPPAAHRERWGPSARRIKAQGKSALSIRTIRSPPAARTSTDSVSSANIPLWLYDSDALPFLLSPTNISLCCSNRRWKLAFDE